MYNLLFKPLQLIKNRLVLFFILIFIFLLAFFSGSTEAAMSNYDQEYSSSRFVPIYKVQRNDNKIALTVDGAWGSNQTEALIELFKKEEIQVSFFFAGIWINNNSDLVEKIIDAGHEIYNHSYTHPHFNNLTKKKIIEEIKKTEAVIDNYYDQPRDIKLFRPPYGEYNDLVISTARDLGYQVIQWSLDSHDWMDPGEKYIINRIENEIDSGDILLFHNDSKNVVEILAQIIPELKKKYQFVKIEDLIYNNNYQISSFTGLQYIIKDDVNGN